MARKSLLMIVVSVLLIPSATPAQIYCEDEDVRLRVGILYHNTDARKRVLDGVLAAIESSGLPVCLIDLPYTSGNQGLVILRDAITNGRVDVIIGPTESDIFVRALEEHQTLDAFKVPVISPLITAEAGNETTGWFFRTNISVRQRAQLAFDYLDKHWTRNLAVLYADTEFGRRGEEAFQDEVIRRFGNTDTYISVSYEPPPESRFELEKILKTRPEALGIFGEREDIPIVIRELAKMSQGRAPFYEPILFTILDATEIRRDIDGKLGDLYYVSVTNPDYVPTVTNPDGRFDDVKGLAHDTMIFVIDVLEELETRGEHGVITLPLNSDERRQYREMFRDQLCAVMAGGSEITGPITGMEFNQLVNECKRRLYKVSNGEIHEIGLMDKMTWYGTLWAKIGRIKQRFSYYPLLAIVALFLVVILNVTWDMARWYEGRWYTVFKFRGTYAVVALNFIFGAFIYVILAETGKIRYDSWEVAVVIGFVPSQFLRLKFFETQTGQSVGLVAIYDWILHRLNEGMMVTKFDNLETKIEAIAHFNSEEGMKSELRTMFACNRNRQQGERLWRELETDLENEKTSWERRKRCARTLLKRLNWEQLQHRRLLPQNLSEDGDLESPILLIRESKRYIEGLVDGFEKLNDAAKNALSSCDNETKVFYERKVKEADTQNDKTFARIRFLVLRLNYTKERLEAEGLLPTTKGSAVIP